MTNPGLGMPQNDPYTPVDEPGGLRMPTITSEQIRAARGLLKWEKQDLAEAAGLSVETVKSIERRPGPLIVRTTTLYALQRAFEDANVIFFDSDNGGAGVRWKVRR